MEAKLFATSRSLAQRGNECNRRGAKQSIGDRIPKLELGNENQWPARLRRRELTADGAAGPHLQFRSVMMDGCVQLVIYQTLKERLDCEHDLLSTNTGFGLLYSSASCF